MNRRDASTSCWRHPSQRGAGAGVCADCLKERLSALSPTTPPHRSSFGASASASSAAHHLVKQSGSNPHHVLSPLVSDAYLRRSKSCSAAGGSTLLSRHPNPAPGEVVQSNVFGCGRKSDAVLDDWTRQRFFSILAKDQKLSSSSNFRGTTPFPDRLRHPTNNAAINKAVVDQPVSSTLSSRTVLLENASTRNQQPEPGNGASTGSTSKPRKWLSLLLNFKFRRSKTTRKEVSQDHEQASRSQQDKVDLIKQGSSSRNRFKQPGRGSELWPLSPLRFFSQVKKPSKAKTVAAAAVQDMSSSGEDHPQLQRSSWSTPPSSSDTKKQQSYTTAYYRDYGGWSLSSSPVPNGKPSAGPVRGSNSKQCSSRPEFPSSPYHRAAAAAASPSPSTWNFYLTPLRLAKATTSSSSKHRY